MNYKYIYSDSTDPYINLAFERCLLDAAEKETAILFLWQNDHTIVIGRNQDVYAECRVREFLADGGKIARRRSGGGAVYHDLGNLNFSLIGDKAYLRADAYQQLVLGALRLLGASARFNGRNDLTLGERKFSGNACYDSGKTVCQHGTILVATDIEKMSFYLTPEKSKLSRNRVASVSARVMNLTEEFPDLTIEKMRGALTATANADPFAYAPDKTALEQYAALFRDEKWIFGGED